MKLSLERYLFTALKWIIPGVFFEAVFCALYFTGIIESAICGIVCVGYPLIIIPGIYYLIMFFVFKKKCENFTPSEGVIVNWEAGFFRPTGAVIVKVDDKEYSTSAYFNQDDAKEMVGKTVTYAIIDETLFIYEIIS